MSSPQGKFDRLDANAAVKFTWVDTDCNLLRVCRPGTLDQLDLEDPKVVIDNLSFSLF